MWRKSSYSGNNSNCVEVDTAREVLVRDSKNPKRQLRLTPEQWQAFIKGVVDGRFNA